MLFHHSGHWKNSCALLISVQYGSDKEIPATRGLTHFAEHLMFCATDDFPPGPLADAMHDLTNGVEATTSRKSMRLWTQFHKNDTQAVIHLLSQMLYHWQCPAENIEDERDILLREWEEYQESGDGEQLERMHRLMNVQSPNPLGTRAFVKGISARTVEQAKKHWNSTVLKSPTSVIALGAFSKVELALLESTFTRSYPKNAASRWNGSKGTFKSGKMMAGLYYTENTPHPLAVLLDRIFYWRWSHAMPFSGYRMYSVGAQAGFFVHNRSKPLSVADAREFLCGKISRDEFEYAKKMSLQYWEGTLDILDTKDTLYWFDGFDTHHYSQWDIHTPLEAYRFYATATYEQVRDFHARIVG